MKSTVSTIHPTYKLHNPPLPCTHAGNLRTWVEVDTANLTHNIREIRKILQKDTRLLVVVKSNAYGHGLVGASRVAQNAKADYLGVDSIDEANEIQKNGISLPILILGYTPRSRLNECVKGGFIQSLYNLSTTSVLSGTAIRLKKRAQVHLKIETGTARQGVSIRDLPKFLAYLKQHPLLKVEGVYTHFAETENPKSIFHEKQLRLFREALGIIEEAGYRNLIRHAASSAATLLYPYTHFDMVRLGISYYGIWPSTAVKRIGGRRGITLRPALNWKTRIAQIKNLEEGSPVGYGRTERVRKDSRIAILPVGYWDGYPRGLSRTGSVLVRGKRAKILGTVCMNMTMVDVSGVRRIGIEEPVTLIGKSSPEEVSVEEIAAILKTIPYEVITRINPLIPRIYTG